MSKTILIVEDNKLNMKLFNDILQAQGYNTVQASNGGTFLNLVRERKPDLILMDIQMPEMDGLETTKCIRNQSQNPNKNSKIIAMTASVLKSEIEKCFITRM